MPGLNRTKSPFNPIFSLTLIVHWLYRLHHRGISEHIKNHGKLQFEAKEIMSIVESGLTKGQVRKLNALRKSIGDRLAEDAFAKWLAQRESAKKETYRPDPVAEMISETLKPLLKKKGLNLGRYGYSVKRARGKGAKGLVVTRIEKTET